MSIMVHIPDPIEVALKILVLPSHDPEQPTQLTGVFTQVGSQLVERNPLGFAAGMEALRNFHGDSVTLSKGKATLIMDGIECPGGNYQRARALAEELQTNIRRFLGMTSIILIPTVEHVTALHAA